MEKQLGLFKINLIGLLRFLDKTYTTDYSFGLYSLMLDNMPSSIIKEYYLCMKQAFSDYSQEIKNKDETFFSHLKPSSVSGNAMVINEIAKLQTIFKHKKTTPQVKKTIWDFVCKLQAVSK